MKVSHRESCATDGSNVGTEGDLSVLESVKNVLSMKCTWKITATFGYSGLLHSEVQTFISDFTWCSVKS